MQETSILALADRYRQELAQKEAAAAAEKEAEAQKRLKPWLPRIKAWWEPIATLLRNDGFVLKQTNSTPEFSTFLDQGDDAVKLTYRIEHPDGPSYKQFHVSLRFALGDKVDASVYGNGPSRDMRNLSSEEPAPYEILAAIAESARAVINTPLKNEEPYEPTEEERQADLASRVAFIKGQYVEGCSYFSYLVAQIAGRMSTSGVLMLVHADGIIWAMAKKDQAENWKPTRPVPPGQGNDNDLPF